MAVSAAAIKAIATAAADNRTWKAVAVIVTAVLTPIILITFMMLTICSAVEDTTKNILDCCFQNKEIPSDFTAEQMLVIENMRLQLTELNSVIEERSTVEEEFIDGNMAKAVFCSLQFGMSTVEDGMLEFDYELFFSCFSGLSFEQLDMAYENVSKQFPQYDITEERKIAAVEIYKYLNKS